MEQLTDAHAANATHFVLITRSDAATRRAERLRGLLLHDRADAEEDQPEGADRFRDEIPRALIHSVSTIFRSRRFESSTRSLTAAS